MNVPRYAAIAQRRADQRRGTIAGMRRFFKRYQTSPDKQASRERRRCWSRNMPAAVARHHSEGLRAVGGVIASEVKRHGICDWCVDKIAAVAGVCRTTVQNFLRDAQTLRHIEVEYREVPNAKSLTNVIRVRSKEWTTWVKRGPVTGHIGLKPVCPTETRESSLGAALDRLGDNMTPFWVKTLVAALNGEPAPRYGPS